MIATMDAKGVITIKGESPLEAFALARWVDVALVMERDQNRLEGCHWRGSKLMVQATEWVDE